MSQNRKTGRHLAAVVAAVLTAIGTAVPGAAQIPETYENLQVLPEGISRDSLVAVMRGFSLDLGVRCHYCHVGQEGQPFSEWDFPSDEKREKRVARFMLRMTQFLNEERLPSLPAEAETERRDPPVRIRCETCHRGVSVPRPLEDVLALTIEGEGIDAAIAQYGELRSRYHGTGSYDFGERRLLQLATRLHAGGAHADAVRVLHLNIEHYPESAGSFVALAQAEEALGNRAAAITALERAAALQPRNQEVQRMLGRLRGGD